MAKQYELTYTAAKNASTEETGALFERVISYLPQVVSSAKGYDFFTAEFYAEPDIIEELNKKLKLESQIGKYLITKTKTLKPSKARRLPPTKTPVATVEEQKVEKAELKEIDQKLKEIFGE